MPVPVSARSKA